MDDLLVPPPRAPPRRAATEEGVQRLSSAEEQNLLAVRRTSWVTAPEISRDGACLPHDFQHRCSCTVTYTVTFDGVASEEERAELAEMNEDAMAYGFGAGAMDRLSHAGMAETGGRQHSVGSRRRSASCLEEYGVFRPVHAGLTIGPTSVGHNLTQQTHCSACSAVLPVPARITEATAPASVLLDAMRQDWKDSEMRRGLQAKTRYRKRNRNDVFNRGLKRCTNVLYRRLACWRTPRLPVLNLSATLFILLVWAEGIWMGQISIFLIAFNSPECPPVLLLPNATATALVANATNASAAAAPYGYHGYSTFKDCSVERSHVLFFGWTLLIGVLAFIRSSMQAIIFENPFELLDAFFIALLQATITVLFVVFHREKRLSYEFEKTIGNKCSSFRSCSAYIIQLAVFGTLLVIALAVVRDFGWRAYRKFGVNQKLKRVYRQRMIFYSFLKVDLTLNVDLMVSGACYLLNPEVWPDARPISGIVLFSCLLAGIIWVLIIYHLTAKERRLSLFLLPVGLIQPAALIVGLQEIIRFEWGKTEDPASPYYRRPGMPEVWWEPLMMLATLAILLRFLLLWQIRRVSANFGSGLGTWTGPAALHTGLFAAMSKEQFGQFSKAYDVMCRGVHLHAIVGTRSRPRPLFVLLTQNGSMLRWSWKGYLLLDEVFEIRHHGIGSEFGRRGFTLCYGHDYNRVITLLFDDEQAHYAWTTGIEALLRETRRKLGVQHRLRELLLQCYKAHHDRNATRREARGVSQL